MLQNMEGKVALVTGGSSGIGRATAMALAHLGVKILVADIQVKEGEETVQMIEKSGGQGIFVETDVTRAKDIEALIQKAVQAYGRLDYAYNNAGIEGMSVPIVEYKEETWDHTVSVNLKGIWLCLKYEIQQMLKQGKGAIVNTSSLAGLGAIPNASAYIASKHGVIGLTKAAAVECRDHGIRVNAICPGPVDTPMMDRLLKKDSSQSKDNLGTAGGIAEVVVWLFSDAATHVNGHIMVVDDGKMLGG